MEVQELKEQIAVEIQFLFQGKRPPSWSDGVKDMRLEQADSILSLLDSPDSPYILKSEAEKRIREIVNPFEAAYNINACRTYLDMKTGFNSAIQKAVELFEEVRK